MRALFGENPTHMGINILSFSVKSIRYAYIHLWYGNCYFSNVGQS